MIVVDTNVISELIRPAPAAPVMTWLQNQRADDLWTTAITKAELLLGVALKPNGRKKAELAEAIEAILSTMFAGRILAFDSEAARHFPAVVMGRRKFQLNTDEADGQIAAIAKRHGIPVATRNSRHFVHSGAEIINPWNE